MPGTTEATSSCFRELSQLARGAEKWAKPVNLLKNGQQTGEKGSSKGTKMGDLWGWWSQSRHCLRCEDLLESRSCDPGVFTLVPKLTWKGQTPQPNPNKQNEIHQIAEHVIKGDVSFPNGPKWLNRSWQLE